MKLRSLTIHNFRSIRSATLSIEDYALLVGANNAGKSTVVDCIRAIYEKDKYKFVPARDLPRGPATDGESWAELAFDLTDEEYSDVAEKYRLPGNRLRLRKVFKSEQAGVEEGTLYGYLSDGTLDTGAFYGAKGVQNGKIGEVIYIPAVSTVDEHTKLSGPSALRDLMTDLLSGVVEGSKSYEKFSNDYITFVEDIRQAKDTEGRSLADFEQELDDSLEGWNAGFQLAFRPPSAQDLVKSLLGWGLRDDITAHESQPGSFGSGFQRHFIFSLISIGAKYAKTSPKKKSKDFTPSLRLLLFEEPEAFLHPPQQSVLSNELRRLAHTEDWQVICSTHSPHFVSRRSDEIKAVIRLRKRSSESQAFQVTAADWEKLLDARKELEAIVGGNGAFTDEEKHLLEALRYFLWLNPDRSGLFFSDKVLVVEGLSEVGLINRLMDDGRLQVSARDCYVLNCEGKYNIHRFMTLLSRLGIQHVVLFDEDGGKNNHAKLNELIERTCHPELTRGCYSIKGDLESFLGMPKLTKADDRLKPLLAIQRYEAGEYEPSQLQELCDRLQALLA